MTDTFTCANCGTSFPTTDHREFAGEELCPACLEEETVCCSRCGTRIWSEDNAGTENTPLCQECYDRYYTNCEHCGVLLSNSDVYYEEDDDDAPPLCYDCFQRSAGAKGTIHDYYFKPDPIFYGTAPRYFGVELEIDDGGENSHNAARILNLANDFCESRIYCKHDGSLNDGFEIVTHPMSLDYHLNQMPWAAICKETVSMGYTSHQARTCGLHIHVSRTAFGENEAQQDLCIARILYFFEKHWEELLKFSRRTQRQLEHWAARYGFKEQPMEILDHAKKGYHSGRYACVNLTNRHTIEFRIFRGTLKYNTLAAALQLVDRICDVALCLSDEELKALSWTTFASGCQAPELVRYLKERRLYVNEPVELEEEI